MIKSPWQYSYKSRGRILFASFFVIINSQACHKKATPVITERNAELPKKTNSIYPPVQNVAPDTVAGRQIFTARCGRCHGLPEAKQFTVAKWDGILPDMFPRARLTNEEALHVRTFILSNAKK